VLWRQRVDPVVLLVALTGWGVAACGSTGSPSAGTSTPVTSRAAAAHRSKPARSGFAVGHIQHVHTTGTTLSVTVSRVIEPLSGSGSALSPGLHAVGVLIRIDNRGPGLYDSSATGDVSVVPTSGTATPVFAAHGVCQTQLRDFDNYITAGEVRQGCVAFSIENGAKVSAVRFSPHGRAAGRAIWARR
jgi:hypothetical protein